MVTIGTASVQGELPAKKATTIVERHRNELRFCFEQGNALAQAKIAIKLIVLPTGAVQTAAIDHSDVDDAKLHACLTAAMRRWTFPAPTGGGIAVVTVPLELWRGAPAGN